MTTKPNKELETFAAPEGTYVVRFDCPEFTALCPKTGQPDFANLTIWYVPQEKCVELKSLKLYLWSFREEGHFHEQVTNKVLADLVAAIDPMWMLVEGNFWVRGGIHTVVFAKHGAVPSELLTARANKTDYRGY